MIELAFSLPLLLALGICGIEVTNLAMANLRVSQITLTAADNASRIGLASGLTDKQLREADIDDILQAVRLQGASIKFVENGRLTLSSLETNPDGGQWIHWQRCIGLKKFDSSYGKEGDGATGKPSSVTGMGPAGSNVTSPVGAAVMFVEANYEYKPMFTSWMTGTKRLSYTASFVVRDKRDLNQVYYSTSAAQKCDKYAV